MAPFTSSVIDTFSRNESPLSDSGRWYQPRHAGSSDFLQCGTIRPSNGCGHVVSASGHGFCFRISDPGASYDQEIAFGVSGIFNAVHVLLRADLAGNFYWCSFTASGVATIFEISKMVGYTHTSLTSATLPIDPADIFVGARVVGKNISMWYREPPGAWTEAINIDDSTYTSGLVGFGADDAVFSNVLSVGGGKVTGERPGETGVFTPPRLIPFARPPVR